ncbi:hypothetical protein GUJ93_ZPchr0012g19141 [Zizania palustris]|uniref:DYW domain-containing protein n=1 Tax=Zizania palustris TaxID=103762 RepID=A0A8J6BS17_ZIZPA|nr:hypothetical protein GUJ93_ZPchr0012g19141 [Zizania palustris]
MMRGGAPPSTDHFSKDEITVPFHSVSLLLSETFFRTSETTWIEDVALGWIGNLMQVDESSKNILMLLSTEKVFLTCTGVYSTLQTSTKNTYPHVLTMRIGPKCKKSKFANPLLCLVNLTDVASPLLGFVVVLPTSTSPARAKPSRLDLVLLRTCSSLIDPPSPPPAAEARTWCLVLRYRLRARGALAVFDGMPCRKRIETIESAEKTDEAWEFLHKMPFEPTASMWGSLLGSCRINKNIRLARIAAEQLFHLEPENGGNHVLLSDVYAASGNWENVVMARKYLKDSSAKKEMGRSWIEAKGKIHIFVVGERGHPEITDVYNKLDEIYHEMRKISHRTNTQCDLHDVNPDQKEELLKHHKRLVIVRDINRFHHFKDGSCSCGDFW